MCEKSATENAGERKSMECMCVFGVANHYPPPPPRANENDPRETEEEEMEPVKGYCCAFFTLWFFKGGRPKPPVGWERTSREKGQKGRERRVALNIETSTEGVFS